MKRIPAPIAFVLLIAIGAITIVLSIRVFTPENPHEIVKREVILSDDLAFEIRGPANEIKPLGKAVLDYFNIKNNAHYLSRARDRSERVRATTTIVIVDETTVPLSKMMDPAKVQPPIAAFAQVGVYGMLDICWIFVRRPDKTEWEFSHTGCGPLY